VADKTVLYAVQSARGAKMVDFHGWDMPVQFAGIATEHAAVRTACGVFDLGHMGRLHVDGPSATTFLARHACRDLTGMKPGQVRYALVLAEDGTVEDDILLSKEADDAWHVVVNASNRDKVLGLWRGPAAAAGVRIADRTADEAMIAVQGPRAAELLAGLGLEGRELKYYAFVDRAWRGTTVRLSRTGYTGEDGFECFVPTGRASELWQAVADAGATLCGLGARDTLRLEAGMPLYGNELDRQTTPAEAGLGFAINKHGGFIGAERVLAQLRDGPARRLVGLRVLDKRVPRSHYPVLVDGRQVGQITSGTLSPTLGQAIGMAYVESRYAEPGTAVTVDIRGTACSALVVALPFYKRPKG
jgi:aminomethyltransferase